MIDGSLLETLFRLWQLQGPYITACFIKSQSINVEAEILWRITAKSMTHPLSGAGGIRHDQLGEIFTRAFMCILIHPDIASRRRGSMTLAERHPAKTTLAGQHQFTSNNHKFKQFRWVFSASCGLLSVVHANAIPEAETKYNIMNTTVVDRKMTNGDESNLDTKEEVKLSGFLELLIITSSKWEAYHEMHRSGQKVLGPDTAKNKLRRWRSITTM
jgi:hypothetical protein